ncbi:unnamed protein product [Oppiella nova]|uniref:C2H2-type domain-containing protein n=1 Tax=Oppiella nova TaxID=334625 RepID=A0A7R9QC62_9ACAR|nr:unnamed protein product [Oppiella nova]CAG2162296.1 unnamed protein product [Oppiella nova]
MSDTDADHHKRIRSPVLPQYVEVFDTESKDRYQTLTQKIPLVSLMSSSVDTNKMTSTELRLRRWFKCTQFEGKCFATRNTCHQFLAHLADKHPDTRLFCLYCSPISGPDPKKYFTHEKLVEHIRSEHCYRQYQCNLCLYRSISVEHIVIHQQSVHSRNFEVTVAQTETDEESHKDTTPHNQQTIKECKVIECTQLADTAVPDADHYFENYKHKRLNGELNAYQCLYCPYLDTSKEELYAHCVAAHPDFPILIYTGINARHSVNGDKDDNEMSEAIMKSKTAKKRSFDESFSDSDVTTNGVVDTYEFDIWTESEDEDMLLSEDDLSSDGLVSEEAVAAEPAPKRQRTEPDSSSRHRIQDILRSGTPAFVANRTLRQSYYLAAALSALLALYFSAVVLRLLSAVECSDQQNDVNSVSTKPSAIIYDRVEKLSRVKCIPSLNIDWNLLNYKLIWGIDYTRDIRRHTLLLTKADLRRHLDKIISTLMAIQDKKDCLSTSSAKDLIDAINHLKNRIDNNLNLSVLFNSRTLHDNLDEFLQLCLRIAGKIGAILLVTKDEFLMDLNDSTPVLKDRLCYGVNNRQLKL